MPRKLKEAKLHPDREIPAKQTSEDEAAERLLAQEPDLQPPPVRAVGIDEDGRVVFEDEIHEWLEKGKPVKTFSTSGSFAGDPNANSLHATGHAMDVSWTRPEPTMIVSPSVYEQLTARGVDTVGARRYEAARVAQRQRDLERDIEARCAETLTRQVDMVMTAARTTQWLAAARGNPTS